MRIKAASVELPKGESSSCATVPVRKRMNILKEVVEDRRGEDRREFGGPGIPPFQEIKHQGGNIVGVRWQMIAHAYADGSIGARPPLIHDVRGEETVEFKEMFVADLLESGVLLDISQPGEVIRHFALEPRGRCRDLASLFKRAYFLKSQRIALDGCGSMAVAGPGILLERRNPRQPNR